MAFTYYNVKMDYSCNLCFTYNNVKTSLVQTLQMGQLAFLKVCRVKINGHQAVHLLLPVCKGFLHAIFAKRHLKNHYPQEEFKQRTESGDLGKSKSTERIYRTQ